MRKIIIDREIFDQFPSFKRGVIIVSDIKNTLRNKRIKELLNKEIEKRANFDYLESDIIKSWDKVYQDFGSNPNRFPSS